MIQTIQKEINSYKKKRDAVILAHNYTVPEVQDIADLTGDSFELSRFAVKTGSKVIVFCGVRFMAETAKILNPEKIVLMPDSKAGCPLADMIKVDKVLSLKKKYPEAAVISYVNSSAEVKAESDICCTSANAVNVVDAIPKGRSIIFVPDRCLGLYVEQRLKRELILSEGFCPVHLKITPQKIRRASKKFPNARVLVHPECTPGAIQLADEALSTGQMLKYVRDAQAGTYLIGTETGMIYPLSKIDKNKKVAEVADDAVCPDMKLNTLEKILRSLKKMKYEIRLDDNVVKKAKGSLEAMIKISG